MLKMLLQALTLNCKLFDESTKKPKRNQTRKRRPMATKGARESYGKQEEARQSMGKGGRANQSKVKQGRARESRGKQGRAGERRGKEGKTRQHNKYGNKTNAGSGRDRRAERVGTHRQAGRETKQNRQRNRKEFAKQLIVQCESL